MKTNITNYNNDVSENKNNYSNEGKLQCERSRSASPEMLTASQDRRADHRSRTSILFYTPLSASTFDHYNNKNNNDNNNIHAVYDNDNEVKTSKDNTCYSNTYKNISSQPLFSDTGENDYSEDEGKENNKDNVIDISVMSN